MRRLAPSKRPYPQIIPELGRLGRARYGDSTVDEAESSIGNPLSLIVKGAHSSLAYPNMVNGDSLGQIKISNGVLGMGIAGQDLVGNEHHSKCFGSDFHRLSQDLRNPLNSISGFAELLLMDEGLSSIHADYVRAILTGSEALTAVVVSLLDRVEARDPTPAALAPRKPFAEAAAAPRRSLFARASRWGSQRRRLSKGRSGTL